MQKLEGRDTYTPTDASQVRSNCDLLLNREETLSVTNLKTPSNNSDVNQLRKERQNLRVFVYVLNMRGQPLMPTTPRKARILLKKGKAKVVQRKPFTIQLKYPTGETKQDIVLGVDTGFKKVGLSAITKKDEILSIEANLRTDIPKKLIQRRQYRRNRRNRKWHRKPRFNNRSRKNNWLSPSVQHKLDSHIRLINFVKTILPVTKVIVEKAKFDIMRINHPEWEGTDFQHGDQYNYENVKMYVRDRDSYKCRNCGNKKERLEVHHIVPKIDGGSDRPDNLATLCESDHNKYNLGKIKLNLEKPSFHKTITVMNIISSRLSKLYSITYGYITKCKRLDLDLEKSHLKDAFVIAGGSDQIRVKPYSIEQVRRNNRSIQTNRKGFKPSIRRQRYKLQPKDLIIFKNLLYEVKGMFNCGKWIRLEDNDNNVINTNVKNVKLVKYGGGI